MSDYRKTTGFHFAGSPTTTINEITALAFYGPRFTFLNSKLPEGQQQPEPEPQTDPAHAKLFDPVYRNQLIELLDAPTERLALIVARGDYNLALDLKSFALFQAERGRYDPAMPFLGWCRTCAWRKFLGEKKRRDRAAGGEDDVRLQLTEARRTVDAFDDVMTVRLCKEDQKQVMGWKGGKKGKKQTKRVLLLTITLLWKKLPNTLWCADLKALGLPRSFPGKGFENLHRAEQIALLADAFGVKQNTIYVQLARWMKSVFLLRFVRELGERHDSND